jgi:glycosyltransferase involved in cell wall biosynthesis
VVLREPRAGTGAACLRAIAHLEALPRPPDAVVFMAADGSDDPRDIPALLAPIESDNAELVIGVRQGKRVRSVQSRLLIGMIGAIYRHRFDDLGPYRAIRFPALVALALSEPSAAFHIEMQVKAIKLGLHIAEVPVRTRLPPGHKRPNPSVQATGRAFFHVLRHSTSR